MASQAVTLFALVSLSLAPERPLRNPPMPNGPQPEFATVRRIIEAQKTVIVLQTQTVTVPTAVTVYRDKVPTTVTVYRQENRILERAFALDKGTAYDVTGKKVSA